MKIFSSICHVVVLFGLAGFASAADPVVDQAVKDAQTKYPPGDYPRATTRAFPSSQVNQAAIFEIHAVSATRDATRKMYPYIHSEGSTETLFLEPEVLMDENSIKSVWVEHDQGGVPIIRIRFTDTGKEEFSDVTERFLNKRLAILVEGRVLSAPVIRSQIFGGEAIISGVFDETSAAEMARKLDPGARK